MGAGWGEGRGWGSGPGSGQPGSADGTCLRKMAEKRQVKRGSRVLTTLVKATVPYAGATVDITCPSASHTATVLTWRSCSSVSRGGARSGAKRRPSPRRPRVGVGTQSRPIQSEPTSSCTAEKTHGNCHTISTSLLSTEYQIDIAYQPRKASGILKRSRREAAAAGWPPPPPCSFSVDARLWNAVSIPALRRCRSDGFICCTARRPLDSTAASAQTPFSHGWRRAFGAPWRTTSDACVAIARNADATAATILTLTRH